MPEKCTIGELPTSSFRPIYRRSDGTRWMKLNEKRCIHVHEDGDNWIGVGAMFSLDPSEEVEVLFRDGKKVE